MKRYRVRATVTISVSTVVTATSKKKALALAADQPMQSFCHQCATGNEDREWTTSGELDGMPMDITAEEEDEQ